MRPPRTEALAGVVRHPTRPGICFLPTFLATDNRPPGNPARHAYDGHRSQVTGKPPDDIHGRNGDHPISDHLIPSNDKALSHFDPRAADSAGP